MFDDIFGELQAMAYAASAVLTTDPEEIEEETIQRWQQLFDLTDRQAKNAIQTFRSDLNRVTLSDAQWDDMSSMAADHDKESYEYYLQTTKTANTRLPTCSKTSLSVKSRNPNLKWIFVPQRPLDAVEKVRETLAISTPLEAVTDTEGKTFIICDAKLKALIMDYFAAHVPAAKPTCVAHSQAAKDLCPFSEYPTLGLDTTLPQYRMSSSSPAPRKDIIQQNDYPVNYFFYGTLAEPDRLKRLLNLETEPRLDKVNVRGGMLRVCRGDGSGHAYNTLVNGKEDSVVEGRAFVVECQEQEIALRSYETARYEVVRCQITRCDGREVPGLTFRFIDDGELG